MLDPAVGAAPARHRGEPRLCRGRDGRPLAEVDRRQGRSPVEAAGRKTAAARADGEPDGDEGVVTVEPGVETLRMPELRVPGIDVDVHLAPSACRGTAQRQVAADVDEQVGVRGDLPRGDAIEPHARAPVRREQRRTPVEAELARHRQEVRGLLARLQRFGRRRTVELLEQIHVVAERAKPERPAQPDPRLSAVVELVRDRPRHHGDGQAHSASSSSRPRTSRASNSVSASRRAAAAWRSAFLRISRAPATASSSVEKVRRPSPIG